MKRLFVVIVLAAVASSALAGGGVGGMSVEFTTAPQTYTVRISGRVTDAETKAPVAGALVRGYVIVNLYGPESFPKAPYQEVTTATDGAYALTFETPLSAGARRGQDIAGLSVSAQGYAAQPIWVQSSVTPEHLEFMDVNVGLSRGKPIRGMVVDAAGAPVAGAQVKADNSDSAAWGHFGSLGRTLTGSDGGFSLRLGKGTTWLVVSKEGYGLGVVWDIDREDLGRIVLKPSGTVSGKVADGQGKGTEGAEVLAQSTMFGFVARATTDSSGRYELKGVPGLPSMQEFFTRKNGSWNPLWGEITVYVRHRPEIGLADAYQYKITPRDGEAVEGPEILAGAEVPVSGRVISKTEGLAAQGLLVRLDYDWDKMVETGANGQFEFPNVSPGKHTFTAYLPHNLRYDIGIGRATVEVHKDTAIGGLEITLDPLAQARVQFVDASGAPLKGITAGATWNKDGGGQWTEGTVSDDTGWAVLFLYPEGTQYVRGFDRGQRKLVSAGAVAVEPKEGQVIDGLRIEIAPQVGVTGTLVGAGVGPLASRQAKVTLSYADGGEFEENVETDAGGRFSLHRGLPPGAVTVTAETTPLEYAGKSASPVEVRPGETKDLGNIVLSKVVFHKVTGRVLPSRNITDLANIDIRLDLTGPWQMAGKTDQEGRFEVEAPAGKHRLTAYLPENARFDAGAGHTEIDLSGDLADVTIQLLPMAMVKAKIADETGKPLPGLRVTANWNADLSGPGFEGVTASDDQGNTTMYIYPGEQMYIGGFDRDRQWTFKFPADFKPVTLKDDEVTSVTLTMVPAAGEE